MGGPKAPSPPPPVKAMPVEPKEVEVAREQQRIIAMKAKGAEATQTSGGEGYSAASAPVKMKSALGD